MWSSSVEALFHELLICVTSFFRDPVSFEILKQKVIPKLFEGKHAGSSLRVWVPACSTGEEAYSIAILLQEYADESGQQFNIRVFATDIDQKAIKKASSGVYNSNIAADVSPERLKRFFTHENGRYNIIKSIIDLIIFAEQDVVIEPPLSKIDLMSCRNLLIYMEPDLQKKILTKFLNALNPNGYLFLGSSESIGELTDNFEIIDRKWKLYKSLSQNT